jgi:hypothetical protein
LFLGSGHPEQVFWGDRGDERMEMMVMLAGARRARILFSGCSYEELLARKREAVKQKKLEASRTG